MNLWVVKICISKNMSLILYRTKQIPYANPTWGQPPFHLKCWHWRFCSVKRNRPHLVAINMSVHLEIKLFYWNLCECKGKNVKVKFILLSAMKTHREEYPVFNLCARRAWVVRCHTPVTLPKGKPVPTAQEAGWAPGLVWMGAENLTCTRIQSPHHLAHNKSPYHTNADTYKIYIFQKSNLLCICT
jgi:hypothetical protein